MRETERRIRQYRAQLPRIRERIIASLVLFAFSVVMMTMSAFAWTTLSISPEVSGVTTTIAANGNLEIALAKPDGSLPNATAIGDSNLSLASKNLTWGNFINLTDPSYGLDQIILRPAMLNRSALATNPFFAAQYSEDGRIERTHANFDYTKYDATVDKFTKSTEKGVKAVSSGSYKTVNVVDPNAPKYIEMADAIQTQRFDIATLFNQLGQNEQYKKSLSGLIGAYVDGVLNGNGNDVECTDYIGDLYAMMLDMNNVMELCGEMMIDIFDMYQLHTFNTLDNFKYDDVDQFLSRISNDLATVNNARTADGKPVVSIDSLAKYIEDRALLQRDLLTMKNYADIANSGSGKVVWGDISAIVNDVVDIPSCIIRNPSGEWATVSNIGINNATKFIGVMNSAIITKGLLYRMDARIHTGTGISMKEITIQATMEVMGFPVRQNVSANVYTSAPEDVPTSYLELDRQAALTATGIASLKRDFIAEDTYGLSLDFWIRTNMPNAYLTLEGKVLTESYNVTKDITVTDGETTETKTVTVYLADITYEGVTDPINKEVYSLEENPTKDSTWYFIDDNTLVSESGGTITDIEVKTAERVIGYSGVNRIWDELDPMESSNYISYSTSQGSGSCYTFYPNTPEELNLTLEVLSALKLAFVDQNGKLLSQARLATELYCEQYGQIIVPIVLNEQDSIDLGIDIDGNEIRGITSLVKDEPLFITVLVYLDASEISNDKVLASSDIDGQINIQFGSSEELKPIDDEELKNEQIRISASANTTHFAENATDLTTTLTLNIDGSTPSTVTASFIRMINGMQGSRQPEISFTKTDAGWVADYEFTSPGDYVLRTVCVDGVDRVLTEVLKITVEGFSVQSLTGTRNQSDVIMTADNTVTEEFTLTIAKGGTNFEYPTTARAIFINENNNAVTLNFVPSGTESGSGFKTWKAKGTFSTSGTYKLTNVVLDTERYDVPELTRKIYLGLEAKVYVYAENSEFDPQYAENHTITSKGHSYVYRGIQHEFSVEVEIFDNNGNEIQSLNTVDLYYTGAIGGDSQANAQQPDAQLKWDSNKGRYANAQFVISTPGIYSFEKVVVQNGTISRASVAPTITALAADPVEYLGLNANTLVGKHYAFTVDYDIPITMPVLFKHADAATVYGKFIYEKPDGSKATYILQATMGEPVTNSDGEKYNQFFFTLPKTDNNGKLMEGTWKLQTIKMTNVCDDNKDFLMGEELEALTVAAFEAANAESLYYTIENIGTDAVTTVVSTVYVAEGTNYTTSYSGTFMQSHDLSVSNISFVDYTGEDITERVKTHFGENAVTAVFKYTATTKDAQQKMMQDYGSYQTNALVSDVNRTIQPMTCTNGKFAGTLNSTIHAGIYDVVIQLDGEDLPLYKDATTLPQVTVRSEKPTVKITDVMPAVGEIFDVNQASNYGGAYTALSGVSNYISSDQYYASVYIQHTAGVAGWHWYAEPTVTLSIDKMSSNVTSASMLFANAANANYNRTYTFTPTNLSATNDIGYAPDPELTAANPDLVFAGKQTVKNISAVVGEITYTVDLSHEVTINQPQYPPYVDFTDIKSIDSSFTSTTPSRIFSTDGETLTLPGAFPTWTETKQLADTSSLVDDLTGVTPSQTNTLYFAYKYKNASITNWQADWYTYEVVQKIYTAKTTASEWTVTKEIIGWTDGVNTYGLGETISLTGNKTLRPIIQETHNNDETIITTNMVRTVITSVTQGSDLNTNDLPSQYTQVDSIPTTSDSKWVIQE